MAVAVTVTNTYQLSFGRNIADREDVLGKSFEIPRQHWHRASYSAEMN